MFKMLLPCTKGCRLPMLLTPLFIVGEVVMEILIPLVMAQIINVGMAGEGDLAYIGRLGVLMVGLAFLSLLFGVLAGRSAAVGAMGFARNVRRRLFAKIQELSFGKLDKFSTGSLITRLTTDVTNTQMALMMALRILFRAPFMLVCAAAMAFYINSRLALIFLAALPVLATAILLIFSRAFGLFKLLLARYDVLNARTQENLTAIRVVKAFVRGDYEIDSFDKSVEELRQASFRAEGLMILTMPIMQLVMYGCMLAAAWFGGNMIIAGDMLQGDLMSFISYVSQILMSVMMIAMIAVNLILSRASVSRIVEVLAEDNGLEDAAAAEPAAVERAGEIIFENVSFSYTDDAKAEAVLHDINLRIAPGETVGIIGGTGSGKSTLVQLIPRLYDVTAGRVLVGGVDVRRQRPDDLRANVSIVMQKNLLFSGTIAENLRWGNARATQAEIEAACRAAAAHDFVSRLPEGYQTVLGQGGVNLSGGQKQRLCIARALLRQAPIIILDDSTSAVDTATDKQIRQALAANLAHNSRVTTLIVAQRITSVMEADKIVVLDEGRVDGVGTHAELLANNRIYQEVYYSQQAQQEDANIDDNDDNIDENEKSGGEEVASC